MTGFFDLVYQHRWGIIGTLMLHLAFLAYSSQQVVLKYSPTFKAENTEPIEIEVVQELPEEMQQQQPVIGPDGKVINTEFNQADKQQESNQRYDARFDKSSVDKNVYEELKAMEKAEFDRLAAERGGNQNSKTTQEVPITDKKQTQDPNENKTQNGSSSGAMKGTTTVDYDLGGRRHEKMPKPSYTCIGSGTLVVKIRVNRSGKVISANIDASRSSYTEECMRDAAMTYVYRAKFEASATAPEPQDGTITYRYVQQ